MIIWKSIKGYSRYRVSTDGRVKSGNRILIPWNRNGKGYKRVGLVKDGHRKFFTVHKLVLVTFIGKRPNRMMCRHKDGNKENNNLLNLEWNTQSVNECDKYRHNPFLRYKLSRSAVRRWN